MRRGGKRQGNVGTAYVNRTDLQGAAPVAIQTSPGQVYGARTTQEAGQRVVPVAAPPTGAAPPAPVPANVAAPGTKAQPAAALGIPGAQATPGPAARPQALPGQLPFTGPSERPNEPVTAGLKLGPGPGPEALTGFGALVNKTAPSDSTVSLLASLASSPTAGSDLRDLASLAMGTRR